MGSLRKTLTSSFACGVYSVVLFALTTGLLLERWGEWMLRGHRESHVLASIEPVSVHWMMAAVPVFIAGAMFGVRGSRNPFASRRLARLGTALNLIALIPANVVPLVWHISH